MSGIFLAFAAISCVGTGVSPAIDDQVAFLDPSVDVADFVVVEAQDIPAIHASGFYYEVEDREWDTKNNHLVAETDDLTAFDIKSQFRKARDGLSWDHTYLAINFKEQFRKKILKRPRDFLHYVTYRKCSDLQRSSVT